MEITADQIFLSSDLKLHPSILQLYLTALRSCWRACLLIFLAREKLCPQTSHWNTNKQKPLHTVCHVWIWCILEKTIVMVAGMNLANVRDLKLFVFDSRKSLTWCGFSLEWVSWCWTRLDFLVVWNVHESTSHLIIWPVWFRWWKRNVDDCFVEKPHSWSESVGHIWIWRPFAKCN